MDEDEVCDWGVEMKTRIFGRERGKLAGTGSDAITCHMTYPSRRARQISHSKGGAGPLRGP